jgi:hypothetical protein
LQSMTKMMERQREVCGGGKDHGHEHDAHATFESNDIVAEWMIRCNSTVASMMCARPFAEHYDRFTQFVPLNQRPHANPIVVVNEGPKDRRHKMDALRLCMHELNRPDLVPHNDSKCYLDAWMEQVSRHLGEERLIAVPAPLVCMMLQYRTPLSAVFGMM